MPLSNHIEYSSSGVVMIWALIGIAWIAGALLYMLFIMGASDHE